MATQYLARSKGRIALQAAARAWGQGVPWATALEITEAAVKKANLLLKPLPKGKPKAAPKRRVGR